MPDWSGTGNADLAGIYAAMRGSASTVNVYADGGGSSFFTNVGWSPSIGTYITTQDSFQASDVTIALATAVTKKVACAEDAFANNAASIALDGLGALPGEGQLVAVCRVGVSAVSSAVSSATGDTRGGTLSAGNTANQGLIYAAKESGWRVTPVIGNALSLGLVGRDIMRTS